VDFNGRLGFWFGLGFSFGFSIGSGFSLVWILDLFLVFQSDLDSVWFGFWIWFFVGFGCLRLTIQRCSEYLPSHSLFDKQDESIDFWNNMPVKVSPIWKYRGCIMTQVSRNYNLPQK
jgi:hypothetical protein